MTTRKNSAYLRREQRRQEFWPDEDAWTGENEKGFFMAPRTLALIMLLLDSKKLSGNYDLGKVYLELWSRHIDNGVIELSSEADHAYAAGYTGSRAVHTWEERMKILERNGFIKIQAVGNQRYKYVLLVHPTIAVHRLYIEGKVPEEWWKAYRDRQIETKEPRYEDRKGVTEKVVPLKAAKTG